MYAQVMYFSGMSGAIACILRNFPRFFLLALFLVAGIASCKYKNPAEKNRVSFKNVSGINYIEVKRRFDNGLSIGRYGYDLVPSWRLSFYSDDSARVLNPLSGQYINFIITRDHDSLFHIARAWFRAKKITRDSLLLQVMKVQSNVVYREKSDVYLTFYSDKYIRKVLHTVPEALMGKTKRDTLFIQQRSAETNGNPDSSFAARDPAVFTSRIALATVKKEKVEANEMNHYDNSAQYTSPEYEMTIYKTYKDFSYEILVTVDYKGGLHFQRSMWALSTEDATGKEETIKAILNGYIKTYFDVTPGKTLGIPHNSPAILKITGRKAAR